MRAWRNKVQVCVLRRPVDPPGMRHWLGGKPGAGRQRFYVGMR